MTPPPRRATLYVCTEPATDRPTCGGACAQNQLPTDRSGVNKCCVVVYINDCVGIVIMNSAIFGRPTAKTPNAGACSAALGSPVSDHLSCMLHGPDRSRPLCSSAHGVRRDGPYASRPHSIAHLLARLDSLNLIEENVFARVVWVAATTVAVATVAAKQ